MKTYDGKRMIDGLVVTIDGKRLDEHYEVKRLTSYGFEWTYEGESPQQLALAILHDFLGDKQRAIALSQPFMKEIRGISAYRCGRIARSHAVALVADMGLI
jgi:hypothetical protein